MSNILWVVFLYIPYYLSVMSNFFFILMIIAMVLTLASLALGMGVMAKGGELNKKYGNKLMWIRVYMQGTALVLFLLAVLTSQS
jgi:choline-glycine betaine transporter